MVRVRAPEERDSQDEGLAESALRLVIDGLDESGINDIRRPETASEAYALVAAADEWISLASSICCRVYAPASPLPEKILKWSRKVTESLREICSRIERAISAAALLVNASGWTLAVNYPWGVSLGLEFDSGLLPVVSVEDVSKQAIETENLRQELAAVRQQLADKESELQRVEVAHADQITEMRLAFTRSIWARKRKLRPGDAKGDNPKSDEA